MQWIKRSIRWCGSKIVAGLKVLTYWVSTSITAIVAVGGALCGVTTIRGEINAYRPGIALMIFFFGLPLGLIVFGPQFSVPIWLAIVIATLFFMNLHNAWEVALSLKYGGLDYIMATQAVAAAEAITPSQENIANLRTRIKQLNFEVQHNAARLPIFEDHGVLSKSEQRRLVPCTEKG